MPKKRKVNLPLLEVIGISLALHLLGLFVLGGLTLYEVLKPEEPEFEPPPVVEQVDNKPLKMKIQLQKQNKKSSPPIKKITVRNISQLNMPNIDLNMPTINSRVAVATGAGAGAGGLGRGFGSGGIDMGKSAVDFFGIKSTGERIMIIVDASKYMLEDDKGGLPAYQIIKDEVSQIIQGLAPGTLFNVAFYDGGNLETFSGDMLPATQTNKKRLSTWIQKFNASMSSVANVSNNVEIKDETVKPMEGRVNQWVKAYQFAQENNTDAMFLLVSSWQWHGRSRNNEERQAFLEEQGWGQKEQEEWDAAVKTAKAWLAEENKKRRAAGTPEKIVPNWHALINELKREGEIDRGVRMMPGDSFSIEEVTDYTRNLGRKYAKEFDRQPTETNIVLFLGADEDKDDHPHAERFKDVARKNRGKFRILEGMEALQSITTGASS